MLLSIAQSAWTVGRADFLFDTEVFLKNVRMSSMLGVTSSGSKVFLCLMGVFGESGRPSVFWKKFLMSSFEGVLSSEALVFLAFLGVEGVSSEAICLFDFVFLGTVAILCFGDVNVEPLYFPIWIRFKSVLKT